MKYCIFDLIEFVDSQNIVIVIAIITQGGTLHYLSPELLQPQPPPIPPATMAGGAEATASAAPIPPPSTAGSSRDLLDSRTADNWYGSNAL
jgi:hypothetical protein